MGISLDTARKLKDAGLMWEPKENNLVVALDSDGRELAFMVVPPNIVYVNKERNLWLPHLSQLLAEIEQRGWEWGLSGDFLGVRVHVTPRDVDGNWVQGTAQGCYIADTPEEAAGKALLWILEREKVAHDVVHV